MIDLPGVCRSCRQAVWYNGWWWTNDKGYPHTCPPNTRSVYNEGVGSSDESNTIARGARVSATTRDAGVIASHEVVARA